jgi:acetyl esterase/lipase
MINYRNANLFCLFIMLLAPSLHTQGNSGSQPRPTTPESSLPRQAGVVTELLMIEGMNHRLREVPAEQEKRIKSHTAPSLLVAPKLTEGIKSFVKAMPSQQPAERVDPEWLKPRLLKRIVYSVPGMERIKARKDVVWKRVEGLELKLDVYTPPGGSQGKPLPAIVFIHGGPIPSNLRTEPKEWGVYISHGQLAAASGFVGVTFNHRYYGFDRLRDAQGDVNDLVAYLRANAAMLGIDPERITLWAFSGGGLFLSNALRDAPPYVRCLIAYYALLDFAPSAAGGEDAAKEFSPLQQLKQKGQAVPPLLVARAGLDNPALNVALGRFAQEAMTRNVTIDFVNHAAGHHGFDFLDDDERTREIIRRTIEFIRARN